MNSTYPKFCLNSIITQSSKVTYHFFKIGLYALGEPFIKRFRSTSSSFQHLSKQGLLMLKHKTYGLNFLSEESHVLIYPSASGPPRADDLNKCAVSTGFLLGEAIRTQLEV